MIFPGQLKDFYEKPSLKVSWVVLFLNIIIYFIFSLNFETWPSRDFVKKVQDENFVSAVNNMYLQTLDPIRSEQVAKINKNKIFAAALKDEHFWKRINSFNFKGDQVLIRQAQAEVSLFHKTYLNSYQYHFGLSSVSQSPWSWMTYQFVHSGIIHLLGNVLVLFLIISYLERFISFGWIIFTYLFSGFSGGACYLIMSAHENMPVIGASAAVSGLLAFTLVLRGAYNMPWVYVFAPVRGAYGSIHLPVFFIFPLFMISDYMGLLTEPNGVTANVALSAHVGGSLFGLFFGLLYRLLLRSKSSSHGVFGDHNRLHELS